MAMSQAATAVKNLIIAAGKSGVSNIDDVTAATVKKQLQKNGSKLLNKNGTFSAKASKEIEKLTNKLESGEKLTRLDKKTMKEMGLQYRGNRYSGNEGYKELKREIAKEKAAASTPKINTGQTTVHNQSKPMEGTRIGSTEGRSTWEKPAEGPLDEATNNANQAKAEMQRKNQAQGSAEGTAQKEAEQTGAGSSDNGSSGKTPEPDNPTGSPETPPEGTNGPDAGDVQEAMDEEIANARNTAWYNDEAARKHLAESKEADILRENTAFENTYKDISGEYKKGLGAFYEEGNLKGKVKDAGKLREYQEAWGGRLQKAQDEHKAALEEIGKRKVGVMDWVQGHDYDKAAVGIGALGFAGSVAFGGAKSNADLYSNPF